MIRITGTRLLPWRPMPPREKEIPSPCLEILQNSEVLERLQIINGMVPGNITRALNGEHVGTIIHKQ